ncbi:type VII toxin-antitoxin system HepT family RNase toxin [Candidatus Spongiihabitans sp.]|uniref:type VII toxin-antitoxin system HepT family RNase toxin n=1 Tax=Candidatus Spongiihabitans sp. TaxID=3101308 RepID=UPI003C7A7738
MSDILMQKKASIERRIKQARDYYAIASEKPFSEDFLRQDAIVANLHRACEQCIDMANHLIRVKKLGLPTETADSFRLLGKAGIIDAELEKKLIGMVGFRNIVIHEYQKINYRLVEDVVKKHADDLITFAGILLALSQ